MPRSFLTLVVVALCASAAPASADTLAPTRDTTAGAQRLLRFDLGGPARRAVLRLYVVRGSRAGVTVRLHGRKARAVRSGALRSGRRVSIDVTRLVAGRRRVTLALSSRGRVRAPRLVIDREAAAAPQTPVASPLPPATTGAPPASIRPARESPWPGKPCGVTAAPPVWEHVVWVVMDGSAAGSPYVDALAGKCGMATNVTAEADASLPNRIALTSGSTQGIAGDGPPAAHPLDAPNLFAQLGDGWRSVHDGMTSNCQLDSAGAYAVEHNPAAYYTGVREACGRLDVPPAGQPDVSARFTLIAPRAGADDAWLQSTITRILDSQEYRSGATALFVTWDAGGATLVVSPSTPSGARDGTAFTHASLLRTTQELLGLPLLGGAATAASLRGAFGL